VASVKITVFWGVRAYCVVDMYQYFRGSC